MTFNDYIWFYGSLCFIVAVGAFVVNSYWPDTIPEPFLTTHAGLAFGFAVVGVIKGIVSFGQWVIHLFK